MESNKNACKQFAVYQTIAVDFDGTICENRFPDIGEPKFLVIEYLKWQAAHGAKIILHTCRENGARRALLDEAIAFCGEYGVPIHAVNNNPDNPYIEQFGTYGEVRKVSADLYIDDRAVNAAQIERAMRQKRNRERRQNKRARRQGRGINLINALVCFNLTAVGITMFFAFNKIANNMRGYKAIGGEFFFILLPLFYIIFEAVINEMRGDKK